MGRAFSGGGEDRLASPRLGEARSGESGPSGPCAGHGFEKLGNNFEKPSAQHSRRRGEGLRCCASPPQRQCNCRVQVRDDTREQQASSRPWLQFEFILTLQILNQSQSHPAHAHGGCVRRDRADSKDTVAGGGESWLARTIPSDRSASRISYRMKGSPRALR